LNKKVLDTLKLAGMGTLFLLFLGLGCPVVSVAPDNVLIYADLEEGIYYAPQCVDESAIMDHIVEQAHAPEPKWMLMRKAEADAYEYEPDEDCVNTGAFVMESNLTASVLESLGLWSRNNRWTPDGNWNW